MVGQCRAPVAGLSLSLAVIAGLSHPAAARDADNERWMAPVELYSGPSASDPSTWAPELPAIPTPKIDVEPLAEAIGEAADTVGAQANQAFQAAKRVIDRRDGSVPEHVKVGRPYQVDGTWYVPGVEHDYRERGVASWYGADFHGKLTANGEVFDKNAISAAHPTLPLPSLVKVTNVETGQSLVVRVNDRGPFSDERVIDLSEAAAKALGVFDVGTARVDLEYVGAADPAASVMNAAKAVGGWAASAGEAAASASAQLAPLGASVSAAAASASSLAAQAQPAAAQAAASALTGLAAIHASADWARRAQAVEPAARDQHSAPESAAAAATSATQEATLTPASADRFKVPEPLSAPEGSFPASGRSPGPVVAAPRTAKPAAVPSAGLSESDVLFEDGRPKYAVALSKPRVAPSGAFVQAAAFTDPDRAELLAQRLGGPVRVQPAYVNGRTFHRVLIGPWPGDAAAEDARKVVADMGFPDARVIHQN